MNSTEPDEVSPTRSAELPQASIIRRLIAIGAIILGIAILFLYAGGWLTPHVVTAARIVNTFEQLSGGPYPGFRRNHAKGLDAIGHFDSNGQGAALSKAAVFRPGRVPIIGRFSLPGGKPFAADDSTPVRGLGIRFQLSDGEEWRTAMVNLPVFPVKTPQAFQEQQLASVPDTSTGKPDPERMQAFLAKHPESAKAIQLIHQLKPSGFESSTFNSLNTFRFINDSGAMTSVRWSLTPVTQPTTKGSTNSETADKNQLFDALIASVHRQPLQWHLIVTIAQPGDPTDDATIPWPPDRKQIEVGTLTIEGVESDDTSVARNINFDPLILPNGIVASDDPILSARSAVYSQSFTRREGEHKNPSAISAAETAK